MRHCFTELNIGHLAPRSWTILILSIYTSNPLVYVSNIYYVGDVILEYISTDV